MQKGVALKIRKYNQATSRGLIPAIVLGSTTQLNIDRRNQHNQKLLNNPSTVAIQDHLESLFCLQMDRYIGKMLR